ncbi:hypothetical protein BaRGS_00014901, partial [Batillaria attramentaria]
VQVPSSESVSPDVSWRGSSPSRSSARPSPTPSALSVQTGSKLACSGSEQLQLLPVIQSEVALTSKKTIEQLRKRKLIQYWKRVISVIADLLRSVGNSVECLMFEGFLRKEQSEAHVENT